METLDQIWEFVIKNPGAATFILMASLAVLGGLWKAYTHFFPKVGPVATADTERIVHVLTTQLENADQREQEHRDQIRQLTEAVDALKVEGGKPEALPGIAEAFEHLEKGETEAAEAVFEEVKARRKAEGEGALKEAAAAARHIGALAFLHDTDKAVAAYRESVMLDAENADGWNRLGHLLKRKGDLNAAAEAYDHVLSLGNAVEDREIIAAAMVNLGILYQPSGNLGPAEEMFRQARNLYEVLGHREGMAKTYGNLGAIYAIRGDLDQAEEMVRKALNLYEVLGHKEGMASGYGNLGNMCRIRGNFDQADKMYRKSLEIAKALGHTEGMAMQYCNLGHVSADQGDVDQAKKMYGKSLDLFRQIDAAPQIEQVEGLLAGLRRAE